MPASPGRTSAHVVDALLAEQDGRPTVGPGSGSLRTESPAGAERRTLLVDTDRARRRAPSAAVALMLFAILAAAPVLGQNATGEPTISGVHRVGEELTASTAAIADPEGVANATFAYQWVSVDASATEKEIDGATSLTYTLAGADEGGTVKVKVSFTDDGGNTEERTSAAFPESESVYVCDLPAHHASMGTALLTAKLTIGNFVDFIYGYEPDVSIGGLSADTFELPTSNTSVAVESLTYHPDSTDPPNSFVVEFETAATYDELSELAFVVCEDVLPLRFSVLGDVSGNPQLTASRALDWASSLRPVRPIRVYHDRVAPTFVSAIVDGTDLIVEFGELLDERSVPEVGSFDIKSVVGGEVALLGSHLDGVSVSGRTVRLTSTALVSFAAGADRLLVSYREPPLGPLFDGTRILDLQANPVDSFTDQPVRIVAPPTQESAALAPDGRTLVLTFNESLDETSVPAADAFRVKVEGAQVELAASDLVTVVGSAVELRLAEPAGVGESVTASYTKPGTGPIRDTQGDGAASEAASFADFPVENRSTQAAPLPGLAVPGARVLLDTTLTVGRYDDPTTVAEGDFFGYADAAEIADLDAVAPGALGDATFEFGGVEYTVERLTVSGTPGSAEMAATIGDADGTALPDTAAVGIEFGTSAAGHAVLVDWRRFSSDETALAGVLGDVYAGAVGAMLPLRILALEVPDLWSATVTAWGTRTTDGVQAGTLSSTTFTLDGTSYAVDRLANFDGVSPAELEFSTTPDPPDGVRLALASRASATEAIGGLVDYYPLMTAHRPADAAVDRRWPLVGDLAELGTGNAVYLTRDTGLTRTGAVWSTTVTPAEEGRLLGYRRPGVDIGGFGDGQAAGVGSIAPDAKIALDGVDYTVNAIAFTSDSTTFTTFDDFWVHTTPTLPAGTGFGFEVGQKDGTAYYWAGVAGASRGGRVWKLVSSANAHGWDDDSDSDGTLDPRRVRLVRGLAPASMRVSLSVSPAAVAEGATVTATVTAMLDLAPRATDTAVAVTVGAAGDTAVSGTDYAAVGPFALTIPAGRRSASTTFSVSVIDNAETERAESLTVAGTATGVAVAGTRVTIPYNDYGTYLSATLTAAGLGGATGYGPANGALNNTRFGCCVSATGDEVAYTVDLLLTSTTPASVPELAFRYGDLAAAPPDDVLVLHVGGATAPLDAALGPGGAGYRSSNVRRWPLADIGLAPFAEGAAVPVRLTGPKHPRIASVDVVSSAPSNNGTVDVYAVGDVLRIAVGYDEPVAVTGTPTLAFRAETADSTATDYSAAYVEAESTATELVFAYTVAATTAASADVVLLDDTDGTAAGAQSPLSGGSIRSVEARSTRAASRFMPAGRKVTGQTLDGTDSTPAAATVGVDGPAAAAEGDGNVAYAVRLSRAAATERTVGYAFTGTATHATDYASSPAAMSGTLTFAAGRTFKRIMAILADDTVDEADETIVLTLSSPSTGLTLDTDRASVTTTVTDDDLPTVSLAAPPLAGTIDPYLFEFEASKSYSGTVHADAQADLRTNSAWTLTRAGLTDAALDVTVSVAETGEGEFVEADDETTHTVTFEATKTTAYFKIVADDADNERHGSVTATLLEGADYDVTGAASSTVAIPRRRRPAGAVRAGAGGPHRRRGPLGELRRAADDRRRRPAGRHVHAGGRHRPGAAQARRGRLREAGRLRAELVDARRGGGRGRLRGAGGGGGRAAGGFRGGGRRVRDARRAGGGGREGERRRRRGHRRRRGGHRRRAPDGAPGPGDRRGRPRRRAVPGGAGQHRRPDGRRRRGGAGRRRIHVGGGEDHGGRGGDAGAVGDDAGGGRRRRRRGRDDRDGDGGAGAGRRVRGDGLCDAGRGRALGVRGHEPDAVVRGERDGEHGRGENPGAAQRPGPAGPRGRGDGHGGGGRGARRRHRHVHGIGRRPAGGVGQRAALAAVGRARVRVGHGSGAVARRADQRGPGGGAGGEPDGVGERRGLRGGGGRGRADGDDPGGLGPGVFRSGDGGRHGRGPRHGDGGGRGGDRLRGVGDVGFGDGGPARRRRRSADGDGRPGGAAGAGGASRRGSGCARRRWRTARSPRWAAGRWAFTRRPATCCGCSADPTCRTGR